MSLFSLLFVKPVIINDDFFGEMKFSSSQKGSGYFVCKKKLNFFEEPVEIIIDGSISGPTETQKNFVLKLEDKYNEISESIVPLIEGECRNWKEDFKITDFRKEFRPVSIQIPTCENKPVIWEIGFESNHDLNHTFTVTMNNFKAKDILIDR